MNYAFKKSQTGLTKLPPAACQVLALLVFASFGGCLSHAQSTITIHPSLVELKDVVVAPGAQVSASVTYTVTGTSPVPYQTMVITMRPPGAANADPPFYDFYPRSPAGTFTPGQRVSFQASYPLRANAPTGTWRVYATWEDMNNVWHPSPWVTLNVMNNEVLRGINSVDFMYTSGYGDGYGPGTPNSATYPYLYSRGVRLIRLPLVHGDSAPGVQPVSIGGIQPTLMGDLDPVILARLQTEVASATAAGLKVILDLHCSIRFPCSWQDNAATVPGVELTQAQFNDVWLKLSNVFRDVQGIYAYDLANEPFTANNETGQQQDSFLIAREQGVVNALRAAGDNTRVIVEGNNYDNPTWIAARSPWIDDPVNNVEYSGHDYPGTAHEEIAYDPTAAATFLSDIKTFQTWCISNQVKCYIGEWGWPGSNSMPSGDNDWQLFNSIGEQAYEMADAANMDVTFYSAATSYTSTLFAYTANPQGVDLNGTPMLLRPMSTAQTQSQVIEAHPSYTPPN